MLSRLAASGVEYTSVLLIVWERGEEERERRVVSLSLAIKDHWSVQKENKVYELHLSFSQG